MVLHAGLLLAATLAAAHPDHSETTPSEIVVTGKRASTDPPPLHIISTEEIDSFSAETVSDAIAVAQLRIPGGTAPVIVNGQRLGDITDINALPPEAVERIEILPPSAGSRRGLSSSTPIVNIVLKRHFGTLAALAENAASTDGGGYSGRIQLNGAIIRGDQRNNATLQATHQSALRYRDRFDEEVLATIPEAPVPTASLRPQANTVSFVAGKSLQIDQKQLVLSMQGNLSKSVRELENQATSLRSGTASIDFSATLSGLAGHHFWTAIANANLSRADTKALSPNDLHLSNHSIFIGSDFAANVSGPLFQLPSGTASYNASATFGQTRRSQSFRDAPRIATSSRSATGKLGLELPLLQRDTTSISIGELSLRSQAQFNRTTGSDILVGYENAVNWSPVAGLSVEWTESYQALGGSGRLGMIMVQPAVLLFDPKTQKNVQVRQIIGGNPALKIATQRHSTLRASVSDKVLGADFALSAFYAMERVSNPIFSPSPSTLLEQAFPQRYHRGPDARLIEIDARPLNGYRQSNNSLALNFSASGNLGGRLQGTEVQRGGKSVRWMLNLGYTAYLSQNLQLTSTSPMIDLLSARVGPFGGFGARYALNAQGGIGNAHFGTQIKVNWSSNMTLLGQGGKDGSYRQPVRIALDTNIKLGAGGTQAGELQKVRLNLSIDNLLNAKPQVSFPDRVTPLALSSENLDPIGRTVRLSLRVTLR